MGYNNLNFTQALKSAGVSLTPAAILTPADFSDESIAGFTFNDWGIPGTTKIECPTDITDHYVEDNSAVQDHIGLRPIKIIVKGYVGELIYKNNPDAGNIPVQRVSEKLGLMTNIKKATQSAVANVSYANQFLSYTNLIMPPLSEAANKAQQNIASAFEVSAQINQNANQAANMYKSIINKISPVKSVDASTPPPVPKKGNEKQLAAFNFFLWLRSQKALINVSTPYGYFTGYAIENVEPRQEEDTKYMSDFTLTLKEFRRADLIYAKFNPKDFAGRASTQGSDIVNLGQVSGKTVTQNALGTVLGGGGIKLKASPAPANIQNQVRNGIISQ